MKVIEGKNDRFGNYPIIFKNASLKAIHEYLFGHYGGEGFKFVIVLDESNEEFEELEEVFVYFMDEILEEVADYSGKKIVDAPKLGGM